MSLPVTSITIRTTLGETQVAADIFGAWAVHEHWTGRIQRRRVWAITHVRTGLCIPPFYTEDLSRLHATRAAKALSEKFGDVEPGDPKIGKQMAALIQRIGLGGQP